MSASQVAGIMARLEAKTRAMEAAAVEGLLDTGRHIAKVAAGLAPAEAERDRTDHPAGALRASLTGGPGGVGDDGVHLGKDRHGHPVVTVGTTLDYAAPVEFEDQPYLRPAIHQSELDLHRNIAARVRPVVEL